MEFNSFRDFSKLSTTIRLGKKIYNAILLEENNNLMLHINMTNDIENWRNGKDFYKIINGNLSFENKEITLLNCRLYNQSATQNVNESNTITHAELIYRIDRILLGKKIRQNENNQILKCEAQYKGIDCFTNSKPYKFNKYMEYEQNNVSYLINTKKVNITIYYGCSFEHKDISLSLKRITTINFDFQKKQSIDKVLENIYEFRNFLVLILKKHVIVENQYIYINNEKYQLFDCIEENLNMHNKNLEDHLAHRCLKIESITNISEIYQNFMNNYHKLFPLIELYYNVTQYKVPDLTRFINATTMIENICKNYYSKQALKLTKSIKPNVQNAEYKYMIITLIKKINTVYKLSEQEITDIAENIKNARVYYIHYNKKAKKLTYEQQFQYSYFMQDIVLLNIYKIIKLNIASFEYISFNDYFYEKEDLLN